MTVATQILAEGKTKILRPAEDKPHTLCVSFKDAATAFNGKKYAEIPGKGELNAKISSLLFELLEARGIPTCYLGRGSQPNGLLYRQLTMIPLEVVVRNNAYGSIVKRLGFEEGSAFHRPLVEYFWKTQDDPQVTEDVIFELNLVPTEGVLSDIRRMALQINEVFRAFFAERGICCADFKLEFGLDSQNRLLLGDELSPDNFRLRDMKTGAVLDKDVFRLDLGDLAETYRTLLARLEAGPTQEATRRKQTYTGEVFVHSRKNVLSPESKAILEGVHVMGHTDVQTLRAGKRFVLTVEADSMVDAEKTLRALAENVLSNPVVEDYELRIKS